MSLRDSRVMMRVTREAVHAEKRRREAQNSDGDGPRSYASDPLGYATQVLRVERLWEAKVQEIFEALLTPPNRVLVKASHKVGKSHLAGILINWFFDSFNPSQLIQISPTKDSVIDIVWKEVRVQRSRAGLSGLMPRAPMLYDAPDHFAKGMTASSGEAYQGRHGLKTMALFDEAVRCDPVFWEAQETIHRPGIDLWIAFFNPTDLTSRAYFESKLVEEGEDGKIRPKWRVITMDALDHPNIQHVEQNRDGPVPIPAAVTYRQISGWVSSWCTPIPAEEAGPESLEWPRGSGKWYRQGPVMLARGRGQWPTSTSDAIWTEALWEGIKDLRHDAPRDELPEIGIDVARFGTDYTSFHVRWGRSSWHHESVNGWSGPQIVARAKALASEWAQRATQARDQGAKPIEPTDIYIKVDEDGLGGIGIVDPLQADGYKVEGIGASRRSLSSRYPRMRDELWFQAAKRARSGDVGLGRLDRETVERLRQQAMATGWDLTGAGQCSVWSKDVMRELLGRSPDDMDALNLAYLQEMRFEAPSSVEDPERRKVWSKDDRHEPRRRIFGG